MTENVVVPCSHCFGLNRVVRARFADVPICHTCRRHLFGVAPAVLDTEQFDRFVGKSELPVVIDFWASWCGPCKMMAPQFEQAAKALAGEALFAKVDTDGHQDLAARFQISGIPTLLLLRGGREVARSSGYQDAAAIVEWAKSGLGATGT